MQARLAEVVTLIRRREANPITIDDIETMDAMEMLRLAKVPYPPESRSRLLSRYHLGYRGATHNNTDDAETPWRSWALQGAMNELRQSMHTP